MITAARSHIVRRLAGSAASALTKGKSSRCADVGTHLLELVGRASRDRPGRSIVAAIGRRQIFGDETAGVTRRAIDDEVKVPLHDVGPPRDPGSVCNRSVGFAATVARGHATFATKRRALPLTRTGLPPAGSHQLAWRIHSITSSARASSA